MASMIDMEACSACCQQMLQNLSSSLPTPLYKPLLRSGQDYCAIQEHVVQVCSQMFSEI